VAAYALSTVIKRELRPFLTSHPVTSSPHSLSPPTTPPNFSVFTPASEPEVYKILSNCPNKQCDSDPIPTWLLKQCSSVHVPTITDIVNISLISGQFHTTLKESVISPLFNKPTLDKEELSNYRPISNLSHFQNNRTCCQIPSRGSPHFQQSTQFSSVTLLQTSLH